MSECVTEQEMERRVQSTLNIPWYSKEKVNLDRLYFHLLHLGF